MESVLTASIPGFVAGASGNQWGPTRRLWQVAQGTRKGINRVLSVRKAGGDTHPHMMKWASDMLHTLGVNYQALGEKPAQKSCLFVGNHISYLDIPLLMAVTPVVFIAKKQLASWPIFGDAMRSVGTVFVDRDSRDSRKGAADAVAPKILEDKQSVVIFPSGTTTQDELKPWRWGAFVIAKRYNIPVQPFRIRYSPLRTAAFIGEDFFVSHMWGVAKQRGGIQATIEFEELKKIDDPEADAARWWQWSREGL